MSQRGLRHSLQTILPNWARNRPTFVVGYRLLYVFACWLDILLELGLEAVWASWPGYSIGYPLSFFGLDPSTALPLIGQSRGILRGEAESDAAYARRLIPWIDDWEGAGSSQVIAQQIQGYLANTPQVAIVDRSGNWVVRLPNGTTLFYPAGTAAWVWDWDNVSNPSRATWWSDLWIIVTPCEWAVTPGTVGSMSFWGQGLDMGIGHATNRAARGAIQTIVHQWKGAHTWIVAIVWNYDPTLFDPAVTNAGNPNGTWGEWGWDAGDGHGVQPRRNRTARYWQPSQGG